MSIQPIINTGNILFKRTANCISQNKQPNQTELTTNRINLNDLPAAEINKNQVSFRGKNKSYSYLFLNYGDIYNSETNVLPKNYYTGRANREIYYSDASASAPLSQKNVWKLFSPQK